MIQDPKCKRCELHSTALNVCIPGTGPIPADIMLIGEGPGEHEDEEAKPFVGPAGRELDGLLKRAGFQRSDVYITNIVRCRPPANRDPYAKEIEACRMFTIREIEAVKPKVIVALGGVALKALTGRPAIGKARGVFLQLLPEYRTSVPIIATYHPAAALHNPTRREAFFTDIVSDFQLAQRSTQSDSALKYKVVVSGADDLAEAFKMLAQCDVLACDLEWEVLEESGSWPWSRRKGRFPQLISIGFAGRVDGEILSLAVPADSAWEPLARKLIDNIPTIYHLGISTSDLIWLNAKGYHPKVVGDTYTLAKLLNISAANYGLKTLAPLLTEFKGGWDRGIRKQKGTRRATDNDQLLGRLPVGIQEWLRLLEYNAKDCVATLLLNERLRELGTERNRSQAMRFYDGILVRTLLPFAEMAVNGLPANADALSHAAVVGEQRQAALQREVAEMLGVGNRPDMANTNDKVARLVERNLGIGLPRTATGKLSIAEDVRERLKDQHPVFAKLGELATVAKRTNTYFAPWTKLIEYQGESRLHTVYRPSGTITGRSSAEMELGATLQQFPRGKAIRSLVRARDGYKILVGDESQIELRLIAEFSGDKRLNRYYREGKDVHRMTAALVLSFQKGATLESFLEDEDEWARQVTDDQRQAGKPVNFGFAYGAHEGTFVETARHDYGMEFTIEQGRLLREAYFTLYPGLVEWHKRARADVAAGGVWTIFGRWRALGGNEDDDELLRKAINTPVQSAANDICYCALVRFDEEIVARAWKDNKRILHIGYIHDAIVVEVHDDIVDEAAELLYDCLVRPPLDRAGVTLSVPLDAEVKAGQTWGGATVVYPLG